MSYAYTLVKPPPTQYYGYGYRKVTEEQLESIIARLQQPTYTTELRNDNAYLSFTYDPDTRSLPISRPGSTRCRKAPVDPECIVSEGAGAAMRMKRPMSARSMDKLVERLQRPTASQISAHDATTRRYFSEYVDDSSEATPEESNNNNKAADLDDEDQSSEVMKEHRETQRRIQRPTTASSLKRYDQCLICAQLGDARSRCKHYEYCDKEKKPSDEDIDGIVQRVQIPTKASQGETQELCVKYKRGYTNVPESGHRYSNRRCRSATSDRGHLPLISGLSRTKNIDMIVARLFTPTKAIPIRGRKSSLCHTSGHARAQSCGVLPRQHKKDKRQQYTATV